MTASPLASTERPAPPTVHERPFATTEWALFVTVATIWGSSFLLIDIGLDALEPGAITFMRVGLGATTLAVLPRRRLRIEREDRTRMVALSVIWVAVPFTLFPLAEQHINSATTGLLNGGTPIFTAIVAAIWFRHRPTPTLLAGLVLGFVGIVMMSLPSIGEGSSEAAGVAMVIVATMCYGVATNLSGPLIQRYGSLNVMAKMLALATIWTAPYGLVGMTDSTFEVGPVTAVAVLGVVGTGLAYLAMATLVGRVGAPRASFITYLMPVVSLALGVAVRDDEVAQLAIAGIVLVLAGALLAGRSRR